MSTCSLGVVCLTTCSIHNTDLLRKTVDGSPQVTVQGCHLPNHHLQQTILRYFPRLLTHHPSVKVLTTHLVGQGCVLQTLILFSGLGSSLHLCSSIAPIVLSLQTGLDICVPPPHVLEHADQSLNCHLYSLSLLLLSLRIV